MALLATLLLILQFFHTATANDLLKAGEKQKCIVKDNCFRTPNYPSPYVAANCDVEVTHALKVMLWSKEFALFDSEGRNRDMLTVEKSGSSSFFTGSNGPKDMMLYRGDRLKFKSVSSVAHGHTGFDVCVRALPPYFKKIEDYACKDAVAQKTGLTFEECERKCTSDRGCIFFEFWQSVPDATGGVHPSVCKTSTKCVEKDLKSQSKAEKSASYVLAPTCSAWVGSCTPGVNTPVSEAATWVCPSGTCQASDCCAPNPTCVGQARLCPRATHVLVPEPEKVTCKEKTCGAVDCCVPATTAGATPVTRVPVATRPSGTTAGMTTRPSATTAGMTTALRAATGARVTTTAIKTANATSNGSGGNGITTIAIAVTVPVVVIVVIVLVAVLISKIVQRQADPERKQLSPEGTEITAMKHTPSASEMITTSDKAFNIPIEQLSIGPVIAGGSQGQVRKGEFAGKPVAIKELMSVMFDPTAIEELKKEASMLCSIHHPNIVRFYGMAIDDTPKRGASYYLVADLKATDLRKVVDSEAQPGRAEIMRLAMGICAPLEYLHSLNMVHRDLKPENILMDSNLMPFLCDFGLSKEYQDNAAKVDMTTNMGTAAYMAPELSNVQQYALDFSRDDSELELAETGDHEAIVNKHTSAVKKLDLTMASATSNGSVREGRLSSFALVRTNKIQRNESSKVQADSRLVFKLDCYSFGIMLWVLMGWELPFREITPMQILIAVGYHNKRPSTKKIVEEKWPEAVVDLMRRLWAAAPEDRPSMKEARELLAQLKNSSTLV